MKYFVKIKRNGKIMRPFFGHFSSLSEADIIARHESREPNTNLVEVIDDKKVVLRSYKSGEVGAEYKGNPAKRKTVKKSSTKNAAPYLVQISDDGKMNWKTLMKFKSCDLDNAKTLAKFASKFNPKQFIRLVR
jgi:hypothetical protein